MTCLALAIILSAVTNDGAIVLHNNGIIFVIGLQAEFVNDINMMDTTF